jgi:hypothetical protein
MPCTGLNTGVVLGESIQSDLVEGLTKNASRRDGIYKDLFLDLLCFCCTRALIPCVVLAARSRANTILDNVSISTGARPMTS